MTKIQKRSSIRALIFDVGDILYDASVWRRWLADELSKANSAVTYPILVDAWEALLVEVYKGHVGYWQAFGSLMKHFGLSETDAIIVERLAREKGLAVQADRIPMPDVPETLAELYKRGIRLVALSDNESGESGLRKTLQQLGIETYFHAVVSSFDIGHVKPEPEAFDYAIKASGCKKDQCGFVAHDIDELEGAQQHRLFAIGYNYHPDAPADVYMANFSQLLELVSP